MFLHLIDTHSDTAITAVPMTWDSKGVPGPPQLVLFKKIENTHKPECNTHRKVVVVIKN